MVTFFIALLVLAAGYLIYGRIVEKIAAPTDDPTPAVAHPDGVDFTPMKKWRVFLIQLLNIAGTGPIFGPLMGAVFGPVVFLWIVLGSILGGAVHDYLSGMASVRNDGASISEIVGKYLGPAAKQVMRVFSVVLLVCKPRRTSGQADAGLYEHHLLDRGHYGLLCAGHAPAH